MILHQDQIGNGLYKKLEEISGDLSKFDTVQAEKDKASLDRQKTDEADLAKQQQEAAKVRAQEGIDELALGSAENAPNHWDFFCPNEIEAKEWVSAIRDAVDTLELNQELDSALQSGASSAAFAILTASFGLLEKEEHRIDVTQKIRQIVAQQKGTQLALNAGDKIQLFGEPYNAGTAASNSKNEKENSKKKKKQKKPKKKSSAPTLGKKKKQYKLHIMYTVKGQIKEATFSEKDAVLLPAAT